jgi:hypothetical protein
MLWIYSPGSADIPASAKTEVFRLKPIWGRAASTQMIMIVAEIIEQLIYCHSKLLGSFEHPLRTLSM